MVKVMFKCTAVCFLSGLSRCLCSCPAWALCFGFFSVHTLLPLAPWLCGSAAPGLLRAWLLRCPQLLLSHTCLAPGGSCQPSQGALSRPQTQAYAPFPDVASPAVAHPLVPFGNSICSQIELSLGLFLTHRVGGPRPCWGRRVCPIFLLSLWLPREGQGWGEGSWEVGVQQRLPSLQVPTGHTPGIVFLPGAELPGGQPV